MRCRKRGGPLVCTDIRRKAPAARRDLFGHPKGLTVLFATEMWERFSYFGMTSLLVLYLVKYLLLPGQAESVLGYAAVKGALESVFGPLEPQPLASQIFGFYTGFAYLTPILGGYLADRVLGQRRTAIIGARADGGRPFPDGVRGAAVRGARSASSSGSARSSRTSRRRSARSTRRATRAALRAYSIYYVGINIGAFLAPLVAGTLGGEVGWHYGFAAAGVGMLVSLAIYLVGMRHLPPDELHRARRPSSADRSAPFSAGERRAIVGLTLRVRARRPSSGRPTTSRATRCCCGSTTTPSARVDLGFWRGEIPTTWFLALNPLMIFIFTPILIRLWAWQARLGREMSTIAKLAFALLLRGARQCA